jgi:TPR repeat protein
MRDTYKAFEMAQKSAVGGSPLGQYCLGFIYKNGLGVASDSAAALKWWTLSAQSGFSLAKSSLDKMSRESGGSTVQSRVTKHDKMQEGPSTALL